MVRSRWCLLALSGAVGLWACDDPGVRQAAVGAKSIWGESADRDRALDRVSPDYGPQIRWLPGSATEPDRWDETPTWDPARGGESCVDAASIDQGLLGVPLPSAAGGSGCFGGSWPTRYFTLTVGPNELAEVRIVGQELLDDTVWLVAQPSCESRLVPGTWQCGEGWVNSAHGLVIQNSGAQPQHWVLAARRLDQGNANGTFDLDVTRRTPAPNATCESAEPVVGTSFLVDPEGAGVTGDSTYKRALYYEVEVPPMSRATVSPTEMTHHYLFLMAGCRGERLHELYNPSSSSIRAIVVAHDVHGMDDPAFRAALVFEPVLAEGFCETPAQLVIGGEIEVQPKNGGPSPGQCWCVANGRVVFVEVEVAPGDTVEIEGDTGDSTASVIIADQPGQCVSECGMAPAFGFEGSASLRLVNGSNESRRFQLLVQSVPGWSETSSPDEPPVKLRARRFNTLDGR